MPGYLEVETTTAVRDRLTAITAEFRQRGAMAQPVIFGSHRKPEAVLMPVALVERLLPFLTDEGFDLPGAPLPRLSAPTGPRRAIDRPGRIRRG
jgi:hypothetical protein